ncbi:MAG TPA: aldehyde dehydrogenase family protein, partial [bacterium]|nr:aldehyde dehydrogenase family protein [bacterium]
MPLDRDLQSIQEIRSLVTQAKAAHAQMRDLDQAAIDRIVEAMVEAGYRASAELGQLAVAETTYGKPQDKRIKNEFGSRVVGEAIRGMKTIGYLGQDTARRVLEFGWPYGVIGAVLPTTNPTSTMFYKAIIAVKAGNALVASPHPNAVRCTHAALEVVARAAESAGLPKGALACATTVSLQGTQELMRHKDIDLILATGGKDMVKAAYSSGKPAYGVGPGNVPVYVDRSADIPTAAKRILIGKSFDWGTLCSSEQTIVADRPIAEQLKRELVANGAYWLSPEQAKAVERALIEPNGRVNVKLVGHSPQAIAEAAGFSVGPEIRALVAPVGGVGREYPLSLEKLSPVLAFIQREGWEAGCHACIDLLKVGGEGHTLGLYCTDESVIMEFGLKKPVFRICVNTPTSI